ncbi:2-oxo acid dehydrogenase subunit E2 [Mucilaginibacter limnophilus]|uniref:Dihydrolipoamide acetyltransferase component of pyruvate dehydrogenase complex n=1 Tax=Mucilaginibacter limnophilus TaxID=1932778 RepID=A0A3S2Y0R8_9SPHI|nr:dihydrolipoamide acetyltransferase family protein [Mucilaginibacter limnophilus]RVT97252.1 2-oxo acid dehydrogenase subunit E2 [Mucilaginibacter limnophilus]
MAKYQLLLPKMGESVAEATITNWVKKPGDRIDADDSVVEIATDKVDSEVPSPVSGRLLEQLFAENDTVEVGSVIAIIETDGPDEEPPVQTPAQNKVEVKETAAETAPLPQPEVQAQHTARPATEQDPIEPEVETFQAADETAQDDAEPELLAADVPYTQQLQQQPDPAPAAQVKSSSIRFYSPLVRNIANAEGIGNEELDNIPGTGAEGRLTKDDLLAYIENKGKPAFKPAAALQQQTSQSVAQPQAAKPQSAAPAFEAPKTVSVSGGDEIIEMDRMRKLIAEHMVMSKQVSPHVTSFVEADVTSLVQWRDKVKSTFEKREGEKITFTPIFIEAVVKAIKDFPLINVSVNGTQIIKKRDINIGMAAALPSGNLIVPVIKRADQLNLLGLTKQVNDLANRARANKLNPDDIKEGTFTITNVGSFGNVMGTPIINQPQAAILAVGAIKKKPAVIETPEGDVIAIRHMMFLSLSYDHRVIDGALGGTFLSRIAHYLEEWDSKREI